MNKIYVAFDELMFREQLEHWWSIAHDIILTKGPDGLPKDLLSFPGLIYQLLALSLQSLPFPYDSRLDDLKFGPSQTFPELSREYSESGVNVAKIVESTGPSYIGVLHSMMRDLWLNNLGDALGSWNHSRDTIK
jgi:hypothetical protein